MALNVAAARQAIKTRIADRLGLSVEEAAWGIHQIVNESMANAARVHVLERGHDPHRFPVFAFGGAGPVHGFRIAQALGAPALLAPFGAGVMSTVGFLVAPLAFDFVRTWRVRLAGLDWAQANRLLAEMEAEGQHLLEKSGVPVAEITQQREADMRYVGQGHEIRVTLPAGTLVEADVPALVAAFETRYRELYSRLGPPVPVEVINWRVTSSGPKPDVELHLATNQAASLQQARKGTRVAYFPETGGYTETLIYDRYQLLPGLTFAGPAIVEERESTLIIGPGAHCRVDEEWNLLVEFTETHHSTSMPSSRNLAA